MTFLPASPDGARAFGPSSMRKAGVYVLYCRVRFYLLAASSRCSEEGYLAPSPLLSVETSAYRDTKVATGLTREEE